MNKFKFDKQGNNHFLAEKKIAIVLGYFYQDIAKKLLAEAMATLKKYGADEKNIDIFYVPGAFEIPLMCQKLINDKGYDGITTLGAVIRGQTPHFNYICNQCAQGIAQISLKFNIPISFGVLTTDNMAQTLARVGGQKGNKGKESAMAMIEMLYLMQSVSIII